MRFHTVPKFHKKINIAVANHKFPSLPSNTPRTETRALKAGSLWNSIQSTRSSVKTNLPSSNGGQNAAIWHRDANAELLNRRLEVSRKNNEHLFSG